MGKIYQALEKSSKEEASTVNDNAPTADVDQKASPTPTLPKYIEKDSNQKNSSYESVIDNADKSIVTYFTPNSSESEQFRLLKNNILFPENGTPPRSIMVTSASPGEGKSFVAANLASIMAQSIDEFVLLIDCDLRLPSLHKMFGMASCDGLSDYLNHAKSLSSLLKKTFIDKLTLLPAGNVPHNPSELLSSEQMRRMLQEVQTRYSDRYIIIDTPPPYLTSETNALARSVDAIVLVVKNGSTRKKEIENIIDIYGREKILGVVQNFSRKRPGYQYGYYKYGYGK